MRIEGGVALLSSKAYAAVVSGTHESGQECAMLECILWAEPRVVGDCAVIRDREGRDRVVHFSLHETAEEAKEFVEGVGYRISCVMEEALIEGYKAMADEDAQMAKDWEPIAFELWECEPGTPS